MSKQTNDEKIALQVLAEDSAARAEARRHKAKQAILPTPEEDAAITAAALTDPDNLPLSEGDLTNFTPARLPQTLPVRVVSNMPDVMHLDSDVLDSFKATGDGWQNRINEALRDYLAAHNLLIRR